MKKNTQTFANIDYFVIFAFDNASFTLIGKLQLICCKFYNYKSEKAD